MCCTDDVVLGTRIGVCVENMRGGGGAAIKKSGTEDVWTANFEDELWLKEVPRSTPKKFFSLTRHACIC